MSQNRCIYQQWMTPITVAAGIGEWITRNDTSVDTDPKFLASWPSDIKYTLSSEY